MTEPFEGWGEYNGKRPCIHLRRLREYLVENKLSIMSEHGIQPDGWVNVHCAKCRPGKTYEVTLTDPFHTEEAEAESMDDDDQDDNFESERPRVRRRGGRMNREPCFDCGASIVWDPQTEPRPARCASCLARYAPASSGPAPRPPKKKRGKK